MKVMSESLCDLIFRCCEDIGNIEIRTNYSGRGMYGEQCFGMVGHKSDIAKLIAEVIKESIWRDIDEIEETIDDLLINQCQDNMGFDMIVYFPNLQWNEKVETK